MPSISVVAVTAGLILLGGAAVSHAADPPTAGPLSLDNFYSGVWYEQARTPTRLTRGCEHATTTYGRTAQGRIAVTDACRQGGAEGRERAISGVGEIQDPGQNAQLAVRYRFGPFRPSITYRVIAHAPDGQWFISAEPGFEKIYMFSRPTALPVPEIEAQIAAVRALGYAGEVEILTTPGGAKP
ncbi:lipocalin family protein [Phenylobacterium sp.]|uniref:lipocalin family protein n=1 Tax=Phenylobacterium sp. TaxID=1871053 RepID=UPI002730B1F8|nr:lipocalin family protein [Phenylobacterium sp.]MDP2212884.1 lipocalin family protein [Phenylobacterium sp.]